MYIIIEIIFSISLTVSRRTYDANNRFIACIFDIFIFVAESYFFFHKTMRFSIIHKDIKTELSEINHPRNNL